MHLRSIIVPPVRIGDTTHHPGTRKGTGGFGINCEMCGGRDEVLGCFFISRPGLLFRVPVVSVDVPFLAPVVFAYRLVKIQEDGGERWQVDSPGFRLS